jgi:hypothetical protein
MSAMDRDKTTPISVIALRAVEFSADGKDIIISLTTKYSAAERLYSVPIESLSDFVVDLRRLNVTANADTKEISADTGVTSETEK